MFRFWKRKEEVKVDPAVEQHREVVKDILQTLKDIGYEKK